MSSTQDTTDLDLRYYGTNLRWVSRLFTHHQCTRYDCGPAKKFLDPNSGELYKELQISCNWNRTWSSVESSNRTWTPQDGLHACVWVQCMNPPEVVSHKLSFKQSSFFYFQPPREFNLKSNWSGAPVEFFESVNYTCAGPEFHFEADFDQLAWQGARCLSNGSWQLLEPWPSCLKSKLQHIDKGLTCPVTVQPSTAHLLHLSLQDWCAGTEVWNLVCLPICTTISCEWPSLEALFTPLMSPY